MPTESTTTDLAVYDRLTDPRAFIESMGADILKSGMFGCETLAQGRVLALECAARRIPPLTLAERYHLIQGKLSMKAEAMLADFCTRAGGSHKIIERSPERAAIELATGGETQRFELTWEQALAEPFVYVGKESAVVELLAAGKVERLKLKAKYSTPRGRMQMLWARVVSDSVRAMAPEVVSGCYTPEEITDFDYVRAGGGNGKAKPQLEPQLEPEDEPAEAEVIDAEVVDEKPADPVAQAIAEKLGDTAEAPFTPAKVPGTYSEKVEEAPVKIANLASPAAIPLPAPVANSTGKATAHQIDQVKALVVELGVSKENLLAKLARVGAAKVSDMSAAHCQALIDVMQKEKQRRASGN